MTLKPSVIIGIMAATLLVPNVAFATANDPRDLTEEERESGFYDENGNTFHEGRPAINPDFAPDESCNLDVYQLKCIPGSEQDCPEGYHNGEDNACSPIGCPEGYHGETGQCYPDSEGCSNDNYLMLEREDGSKYCEGLYLLCGQEEHKEEEYCIEYCNESPNRMGCKSELN